MDERSSHESVPFMVSVYHNPVDISACGLRGNIFLLRSYSLHLYPLPPFFLPPATFAHEPANCAIVSERFCRGLSVSFSRDTYTGSYHLGPGPTGSHTSRTFGPPPLRR